ncbi:MAG: gamma-glutamyltransferase, partial [Acidobacteriota bacterium]|nr:gamma-glutamyltransferase [Acidobacteriota bacterium]
MQRCQIRTGFVCLLAAVLALPADSAEPVRAQQGMVVAQEPIAADVGLAVLKQGGNAVDAAVAVGFALAVTHPVAGNLGGGGFMLVRQANGATDFLDFRESAPGKASRDMYIGPDGTPTRDSLFGWRSSGVPGSVAGFEAAHKKFGSKPWRELLAPAIKLARDGFEVTEPFAASLRGAETLKSDPESNRVFLRYGDPYKAGEIFKQPDLANTLERISSHGAEGFYEGETAAQIAAAMAKHGGLITAQDLKSYKVAERAPLTGDYKSFHIITA